LTWRGQVKYGFRSPSPPQWGGIGSKLDWTTQAVGQQHTSPGLPTERHQTKRNFEARSIYQTFVLICSCCRRGYRSNATAGPEDHARATKRVQRAFFFSIADRHLAPRSLCLPCCLQGGSVQISTSSTAHSAALLAGRRRQAPPWAICDCQSSNVRK